MLATFAAVQSPTIPVVSNASASWNNSLLKDRPLRLSPRIGLAWQIPGMNGAVVRAGFGVYTNQAAYSILQNLAENIPFFLNKVVKNTAGTPTLTMGNILAANPNGAIGANGVNHNFKVEYNEVWNLTVQKSVSHNTTVSAQYVASRTVACGQLDRGEPTNAPRPEARQALVLFPT